MAARTDTYSRHIQFKTGGRERQDPKKSKEAVSRPVILSSVQAGFF